VPAVPTTDDEKTWASETALDLEAAHTMAPGARLVLIETGTDETTGTTGLPQMMDALSAVVARERIDVVDLSFAVAEQNFPDQSGTAGDYGLLYGLRYGLRAAAERGVSLLASTGDWGATGPALDGTDTYPFPTVSWPSSDPLVTAVGGTTLYLDAAGDRTSPDTAWTDLPAGNGAGGGGLSAAFARPPYQNGVSAVVGARRGLPDISMNASCRSLMLTYSTYRVTGQAGWNVVCGTSEASPLLAGLVADAAGLAHRPLGDIDGALYRLTARPAGASAAGIADVTAGCNTDLGVTGYCAGLGYDPVTGIGTVEDATRFILALAFEATHGSPR
jgi:subtilase family serine protease